MPPPGPGARVVHEQRPRGAHEVQRPGHDHRSAGQAKGELDRRLGAGRQRSRRAPRPRPSTTPPPAPGRAARAAGRARCTRRWRPPGPATRRSRRSCPATSLSAIDAQTSTRGAGGLLGPPGEVRPQVVERRGECGRPGGVVGAVEQHLPGAAPARIRDVEQLEAARPARGGVAAPAGVVGDRARSPRRRARRGARRRRPHWRPGGGPAARSTVAPRRGRSTVSASRVQPTTGGGGATASGTPMPRAAAAHDRERLARGPGGGVVSRLDDRRLLAGDRADRRAQAVGVVEVDVGHHGHAAVPRVRGIEPPAETHLDQREVQRRCGEVAEHHGRQQLELGRAGRGGAPSGRRSGGSRPRAARTRRRRSAGRPPRSARGRSPGAAWASRRSGSPAARSAEPARAMTLPFPFVPATRAPRTASCGSSSARSSARTRPRPSRMPKRPRVSSAARASA